MLNLPWGAEHKRDSFLGQSGAAIAPIFQPMGFGTWEAASSLISGVIIKEIVEGTIRLPATCKFRKVWYLFISMSS